MTASVGGGGDKVDAAFQAWLAEEFHATLGSESADAAESCARRAKAGELRWSERLHDFRAGALWMRAEAARTVRAERPLGNATAHMHLTLCARKIESLGASAAGEGSA